MAQQDIYTQEISDLSKKGQDSSKSLIATSASIPWQDEIT